MPATMTGMSIDAAAIAAAADVIADADALLIGAGAGMGVDSGLPDFRGPEGFWRAYPALGRRGLQFHEVAHPGTFETDPALAWGFYGHRLAMYRSTRPHAGFDILRRWGESRLLGYGVFTSNVDGQFQRAGLDEARMAECHGSIHHPQCSRPCSDATWPADAFTPVIDEARCALIGEPPTCPRCGAIARPNILLFGDADWVGGRYGHQQARLRRWLDDAGRLVVVELGAGTAIPSVRHFSHEALIERGAVLVRINPREPLVPLVPRSRDVSIAAPALATLRAIDAALSPSGAAS
ncbi:MAG: NAD-dependent deacetylase [Burkholderiales bacterium]|nr:NAD-dependent deacetylase [Burkholderiales bacterium]